MGEGEIFNNFISALAGSSTIAAGIVFAVILLGLVVLGAYLILKRR
ncbi:hypothetical protein H0O01_03975 [Candidatus Micrarchaeota archaeon]|nr:hypothetical protein [Candidatus Micrarchaeota archaeon]